MNWITTNIRLPEDLYRDLKMQSVQERKSLAAVIRDNLTRKDVRREESSEDLLSRLKKFQRKMDKRHKGINFSQELIKMRYEQ